MNFFRKLKYLFTTDKPERTFKFIQKAIDIAVEYDACSDEIDALRRLTSFEEFENNPQAPYWCYWYATYVVNGPVPEFEYIIAKNGYQSYWYALDCLNARFPAGEEIMKTEWGHMYDNYRIVFPDCEPGVFGTLLTDTKTVS